MTARNEDPKILEWLRRLQARVDQIDKGAGTRQNDIRLGDWATKVNDAGCIVATNVKTGVQTITCPNDVVEQIVVHEVMWNFNGPISPGSPDLGASSPTWYPHAGIRMIELGMFLQENLMDDDQYIEVEFLKNGSVFATLYLYGNAVNRLKYVRSVDEPSGAFYDVNGSYHGVWTTTNLDNITCTTEDSLAMRIVTAGGSDTLSQDLTAVIRYVYDPDVIYTPPEPVYDTVTFNSNAHTFVVPSGVHSLSIVARGAAGSGSVSGFGVENTLGGRAAKWTGTIAVTPGETLYLQGGDSSGIPYPDGGLPGNGSGTNAYGGWYGGGSTRIWRGSLGGTLLVVCGGGGGGGRSTSNYGTPLSGTGGDAGFPTPGLQGTDQGVSYYGGTVRGGKGATSSAGGAGGVAPAITGMLTDVGDPGSFLSGGHGGQVTVASTSTHITGGSGGGGGYYGGGGGAVACENTGTFFSALGVGAPGGGGSSFADASLTTTVTWELGEVPNGFTTHDWGQIDITYLVPA